MKEATQNLNLQLRGLQHQLNLEGRQKPYDSYDVPCDGDDCGNISRTGTCCGCLRKQIALLEQEINGRLHGN